MLVKKTVESLLTEISSPTPTPGGGSVAALAGALGIALTSMVCNLTIGKKKYNGVEEDMRGILRQSEELRIRFSSLVDKDASAFKKVIEAIGLPKDTDDQQALREAAIREATKEATLVPLEVMRHCIDGLALTQEVAQSGNVNSVSDAGVAAIMLHAAAEAASLNVKINLSSLSDTEFVGWKSDEVETLLKTSKMKLEEAQEIVASKMQKAL